MNLQGTMLNEKVNLKGQVLCSHLNIIIEATRLEIDNREVIARG